MKHKYLDSCENSKTRKKNSNEATIRWYDIWKIFLTLSKISIFVFFFILCYLEYRTNQSIIYIYI